MAYEDEILQKADALMKKHRAKTAERQNVTQQAKQIPILTDIVEELSDNPSELVLDLNLDTSQLNIDESVTLEAEMLMAREAPELPTDLKNLADNLYQKILLDLDLNSDEAIRKHLAPRLEGLLEGAFYVVMEEFYRNVGEMIRDYVAQAIEVELKNKQSDSSTERE